MLYINFLLLDSIRNEQSDSRQRHWLTTSLTGQSRTNSWLRYCLWTSISIASSTTWEEHTKCRRCIPGKISADTHDTNGVGLGCREKLVGKDRFPKLKDFAQKVNSMFGSTYVCRSTFFTMKKV